MLRRVSETVDFLERPAEIEAKGGYVPSGILLWGPPGTGKTLMAEAVAGETGKPYMFVDPSAFIQTFIGVAPMKIKWMYRKVRKLALRYGGVVVFFDEADALGNRGGSGGSSTPAGAGRPAGVHSAATALQLRRRADPLDHVARARRGRRRRRRRIDGEDQKPQEAGHHHGRQGRVAAAWARCRRSSPRCPA